MKSGLLVVAIWLYFIGAWVGNIVKLCNDDFEPNYKEEVFHGVGLVIPPAAAVTVWF